MACLNFPCDFRIEDTDDYSPYCSDCGRRDPMADLVLAGINADREVAQCLADWTVRADNSYEFIDGDGNEFFVQPLGSLCEGDPRRLALYRRVRPSRSVLVGMFGDMPSVVRASWRAASGVRLERLGVEPGLLDPPF